MLGVRCSRVNGFPEFHLRQNFNSAKVLWEAIDWLQPLGFRRNCQRSPKGRKPSIPFRLACHKSGKTRTRVKLPIRHWPSRNLLIQRATNKFKSGEHKIRPRAQSYGRSKSSPIDWTLAHMGDWYKSLLPILPEWHNEFPLLLWRDLDIRSHGARCRLGSSVR